ncbi:MAG: hypothetical protein BKP49_06520 [Treponema sp. CETP13]|nr:MAG: hypothetical protein BKP49_06520 [Treponema sp. CETP13]
MQTFPVDRLIVGEVLSEEDYQELENVGCIFSAEHDAMNFLARAEQNRFLLSQKLLKKHHSKEAIAIALDYLESKKYLDDKRYAEAWLRNRSITKAEGRTKLEAGLCSKGIDRKIAKQAIDTFFENTSEEELFNKAVSKFKRMGKKGTKLEESLFRAGFPWKLIKHIHIS